MSWVPAAGGLYEPTSRTAPRPAAASSTYTFGHYNDKRAAPQAESPSTTGACYDEPVDKLRWWKDSGRASATTTAARNGDIEAFWRDARRDVQARVGELVNAGAARVNKQVGLGSSIKKSLADAEPPAFAAVGSAYKEDFCGRICEKVGRRGVMHSPEAKQACMASKDEARRNKSVGTGTNLTLAQFN